MSDKYFAHMADGWKVEIDEALYKRIRAGLAKYPSGGGTLTSPQVVKGGSIIIGQHIVGIEVVQGDEEKIDETRQFVEELSGETVQVSPESDYGQGIMSEAADNIISHPEFVRTFEESQLSQAAFAEKIGVSATYVANLLKERNPLTASISQAVWKAFPAPELVGETVDA